MDVQVTRFREVLGLLKPVVPRKTKLPILTNIMLKDGQAVATDLETMVIVPMPEADITCLLPYTDVAKMLQYTQGGEYLHIEDDAGKVSLKWSTGSSSFVSKDVQEFPAVPEFVPVVEAPLNSDALIPALVSVLPYVATETSRPVLSGVTLVLGEPVDVAGGDGFRMAYQVLPLSFPQNTEVILPSSSVAALHLLWQKTPRPHSPADSLIPMVMAKKPVSVALDGDRGGMRFVFDQAATAIVKLIKGSPPSWIKLIPKEEPALQTCVMAGELELAVRRVMTVAKDNSGIVRMVFNDATATISAKKDDQEMESSIKTFGTKGAPNRVGLNASYLLDYLKGKEGIVTIALSGGTAPAMFQHQKDPRVLIMPMVVQW
jgi:DNA polymerase III sliding clamp (beta) subunit (PCNA family)